MTDPDRILVIKLAALGDVVQAFGPFAAIRAHHPDARITLLTTPPFAELARRAPWFDAVWGFGRPHGADWRGLLHLARQLRGGRFRRVYDLQTSGRSSRYRWLVGRGAEWSGIAPGASHPHSNPGRDRLHTVERQREQLEMAGLHHFPAPELGWLDADLHRLDLPDRFALLIPGASPGRPGKRWPHFPELAAVLPIPVAVAGGPAEAPLVRAIQAARPDALDLAGRTTLFELGALARRAALVVGNDTGPTHLAAAVGRPTLAIFGADSDPALAAPRGPRTAILRRVPIDALQPAEVMTALRGMDALPAESPSRG
ncbi:glycosyltransferase family 9 protein [Roseomonas sp. BN140053]|uniref:glycosyltransferase family 9 protein n=1 Tax=Roseomonas sp. BN140053 TaxID=3391898 RepID=UPI0039E7B93E